MAAPLAYWDPDDRAFWSREGRAWRAATSRCRRRRCMLSFAVWMLWSVAVVSLPHAGLPLQHRPALLARGRARARRAARCACSSRSSCRSSAVGRWTAVLHAAAAGARRSGSASRCRTRRTGYPTFLAARARRGHRRRQLRLVAWRTSASSSLPTARARRSGSTRASATSASRSRSWSCRSRSARPLFGAARRRAAGLRPTARPARLWLQNAGFVWVPAILVVAGSPGAAWTISRSCARRSASRRPSSLRRDTWILAWLYLGTFGSFIGFAAGFPLVAERPVRRRSTRRSTRSPARCVGALARPAGRLARRPPRRRDGRDRLLCRDGRRRRADAGRPWRSTARSSTAFALLFLASGIGNGARVPALPARVRAPARGPEPVARPRASRVARSGGGARPRLGHRRVRRLLHPQGVRNRGRADRRHAPALLLFLVFYLSCIAVAWWFYARPDAARRTA